jgi:phosphatidylserine synthase
MYYVTQVLGVIDTILSPLEWIPSGLQSALGYETYLNVICSLILGICSVVTIGLLSFDDEKDDKYIHQPFIGLLVTILAIAGGLYGPLDFNLWWTALMPLTFLGSTLFGVLIVKSTFKWLNPQKKAIRLLLQFFPLFLWLLLLQVIIR